MEIKNPATPAPAATPGNSPQNGNGNPPASPAPAGNQGNNQEGSVTIPLKEYRNLQRGAARAQSLDKRLALAGSRGANPAANPDNNGGDPELVERLNQETIAKQDLLRKNMQLEVRGKVRDLLEKDEFKTLPKATRDLILARPHLLSEADNAEEALLDIEDFIREQIVSDPGNSGQGAGSRPNTPNHETPPPVNNGAPAPSDPKGLEDVSKLRGADKTRALIRNGIAKAKGVIK